MRRAGATLHRSARASHCRGLSRCGAQAPDAQAQQLWLTGLVTPQHVGSSQTGARTHVPCIGRRILNHCATREAPERLRFKNEPNPRLRDADTSVDRTHPWFLARSLPDGPAAQSWEECRRITQILVLGRSRQRDQNCQKSPK